MDNTTKGSLGITQGKTNLILSGIYKHVSITQGQRDKRMFDIGRHLR